MSTAATTTAGSKPKEARQRFGTYREAMALPKPAVKAQPIDYPHATQAGLLCRVHSDGTRVFWHRWKLQVPDGLGNVREDAGREEVGELGKAGEPGKVTVEQAVERVIKKRQTLRATQQEGGPTNRLTVKAAWALYPSEKRLHAAATRDKDTSVYDKYYAWFESKLLDELPYAFWNVMLHRLEKGTLIPSLSGDATVGTLGPLRADTLKGIINVGINLYEIAHKHQGLKGFDRTKNPAREAKANLGASSARRSHIPLAKLATAWRAADQLVSPWWRDMLYVYVLTGLRRNLLHEMKFPDIDWKEGVYVIPMYRPGTKRRKAKEGDNPDPIRLPLSKRVMAILQERRRFARDSDGPVWYSPRPTRGRAVKQQHEEQRPAVLTDARAAWSLITEQMGVRFTPQDLRRTFATLGAACSPDVLAVALLMLHSGETLAKAAQIPGVTVRYMQTREAQDRMREAAEAIALHVDKLLTLSDEQTAKLLDPRLAAVIEDALSNEEAEDADVGEDSTDYER